MRTQTEKIAHRHDAFDLPLLVRRREQFDSVPRRIAQQPSVRSLRRGPSHSRARHESMSPSCRSTPLIPLIETCVMMPSTNTSSVQIPRMTNPFPSPRARRWQRKPQLVRREMEHAAVVLNIELPVADHRKARQIEHDSCGSSSNPAVHFRKRWLIRRMADRLPPLYLTKLCGGLRKYEGSGGRTVCANRQIYNICTLRTESNTPLR